MGWTKIFESHNFKWFWYKNERQRQSVRPNLAFIINAIWRKDHLLKPARSVRWAISALFSQGSVFIQSSLRSVRRKVVYCSTVFKYRTVHSRTSLLSTAILVLFSAYIKMWTPEKRRTASRCMRHKPNEPRSIPLFSHSKLVLWKSSCLLQSFFVYL